jgi:hypothetical protein
MQVKTLGVNQIVVFDNNKKTFFSYGVKIATIENGNVILDAARWDYSKTTGKYRNQFLGEKKAETQKKINRGEYKLADLN